MALELLVQRGRLVEVVSRHLDEFVRLALADPFGEVPVVLSAFGLRHPCVCDVADQHVLELVGAVARDRRALDDADQVAVAEGDEPRVNRRLRDEPLEGATPEHAADHCRHL